MNKLTPHKLRELDITLPEGTECYLCAAARKALAKYRKGREPMAFLEKDQALSVLAQKLGRGLKRFFTKDIQAALDTYQKSRSKKMA